MPAAILFGADQPWLRRLLGINVAPGQYGQAVEWRTTESDATNHRRYRVTGKSLDAAGCTGEPLPVIATNRVFLCILHCCMAIGRLFVAFPEAKVGNNPPEVAGEVLGILYWNRCGVRLGAHNAPDGEEAHNRHGPGNRLHPCLHTSRRTPRGKRLWGCEHCYALCTHQFWLCHALRVDLLLLCFGNTAARSWGRTICCSSKRIVIRCLRVRMHVVGLAAVSRDVVESTNYSVFCAF